MSNCPLRYERICLCVSQKGTWAKNMRSMNEHRKNECLASVLSLALPANSCVFTNEKLVVSMATLPSCPFISKNGKWISMWKFEMENQNLLLPFVSSFRSPCRCTCLQNPCGMAWLGRDVWKYLLSVVLCSTYSCWRWSRFLCVCALGFRCRLADWRFSKRHPLSLEGWSPENVLPDQLILNRK